MSATRTAHSTQTDSRRAAEELIAGLGQDDAVCIIFFAGIKHDGSVLGDALRGRFPGTPVIGCSSNGEFNEQGRGVGGAVVMALGSDRVRRCASASAPLQDLEAGIASAARALAEKLGQSLRGLAPDRYAGIILLEGASGREEAINEELGNHSPFLSFLGGSAGDDMKVVETWVYADGELSNNACALLILEMAVPFVVLKTCNYVPTDRTVEITKTRGRVVLGLNGQPAAEYYANVLGTSPEKLEFSHFLANPLGLMIDDEPWLRSLYAKSDDGGLCFAASLLEGSRFHFMRGVDLVDDTRAKLEAAARELGAPIGGGLLFNCAYRMLEAQIHGRENDYHALLAKFPHAGLHSNGESYIGAINQTLVGLLFA